MGTAYKAYRFDEFELDLKLLRLRRKGKDLNATPLQFGVLKYLCEHNDVVVTLKVLKTNVWGVEELSLSTVRDCISDIRKERLTDHSNIIATSRGNEGYWLQCTVEKIPDDADADPVAVVVNPVPVDPAPDSIDVEPLPDDPETIEPATTPEPLAPSSEKLEERSSPPDNESLFITFIACVVIVLVLVNLTLRPHWNALKRSAYIEATLILGGVLYNLRRIYQFRKSPRSPAEDAVQRFQILWTLLLVSWLCLYAAWVIETPDSHFPVITTLLNNSNSLMLVLCFLVLNEPSATGVEHGADAGAKSLFRVKVFIGVAALLVFAGLEKGILYAYRESLDHTRNILFVADLLSGIVGGIAMALCIGRLHSRLLGESTWLPVVAVILYLYVVIQPFYVFINRPAEEMTSTLPVPWSMLISLNTLIVAIALILKMVMFLYVNELIRGNRLLFYMLNAKPIYAEVEKQWRLFKPR
ncbi:MAG TPA: helix-turn-helix domain-containing protein [Pyrinomonadaceae bacterium]|nr:helix-turn-helix domain-containing protein [Pyrinomonadaceae bacterium]